MTLFYDTFDSPIGALTVAGDAQGIHHILFENNRYDAKGRERWQRDAHALREARRSGTVKNLQDRRPELYARWRAP